MIQFVRFRFLSHMQSHLFNIHVQLSSGASGLYNGLSLHLKGVKKVCSALHHRILNHLKRK